MKFRHVLAIESSCDDTSVAIVNERGAVLQVLSADQNKEHEAFGGIVPEIASRNHTYHLMPLIDAVLDRAGMKLTEIDGFAVTSRPGLIGSLLVGLVSTKVLALATQKPFIGLNHLEGHLLAPFLSDADYKPPADFSYPYIALAISGGHTSIYKIDGLGEYQVLGQTIDDAAGEAFDKFGKMVGLGFPGGVRVDRQGKMGNRDRYKFIRGMMSDEHLNFSFSGMKSAAQRLIENLPPNEKSEHQEQLAKAMSGSEPTHGVLADLCAGFQEAVVDVLVDRLNRAVSQFGLPRAVLTGGVSANSRLRVRCEEWAKEAGVQLVIPPIRYCTDNAAMIGYAGILRLNRGEFSEQTLGPEARATLGPAPLPDNLPEWLKRAKS